MKGKSNLKNIVMIVIRLQTNEVKLVEQSFKILMLFHQIH
jgi:hypothetical protein